MVPKDVINGPVVFINGHAVLHSHIQGPAQRPWVHKVHGAAVARATSGVSAPRMLLGPCSKISACWHHPFRPQTACEPSLNTLTPGATGGPWAAKCTDDWREAWLSQRAKDARTKWLTREAADGSKPTNGPKTRELSQRAEDTRGWRDWRRPLRQFEINVR